MAAGRETGFNVKNQWQFTALSYCVPPSSPDKIFKTENNGELEVFKPAKPVLREPLPPKGKS